MSDERVPELQARISEALRESVDESPSRFSEYAPGPRESLLERLIEASSDGGVEGMAAALDEFDRLSEESDLGALRSALMLFLTHHPLPRELALAIPSALYRRGQLIADPRKTKDRRQEKR